MGKINVLKIEPMKTPHMIEIEDSLESLQHEVGGYIEATYPFDDYVGIICNEEGKINGLPLNRAIYNEVGEMADIIAGDFLVVGLGDEDFISLNSEYAAKYSKLFQCPEQFIKIGGKISVIRNDAVAIPIPREMPMEENEPEL
ncbi:hypothetical protein CE91St36_19990 [Christensenellaceae bacterium]|uniref:DUF3846 domain-containing protein n=1 Tax=Christensenella timonensis TaxID=1816678 RepID=UPI00082D787C|nr:DUF3846 domain-containing protein [Christensenella timonensis]BDF59182.1 hypothetical protein CE91St36_19990 [Christensenellaceae bacterium]BDF61848.1 hypothetical protein CE91St37_19980 [Christensenellaceae bacterium]